MRCGDFSAAWAVSDRILTERIRTGVSCSHWPRHLQFVWRGQSLAGKHVFVRCYHGLGDTIQFSRLLTPLRAVASRVTVWVQPELLDLVAGIAGVDAVLALHDGVPDIEYDVDIEIMELAHALRLMPESIPRSVPYLFPPPQREPQERGFQVGLVWAAGEWDARRSVPLALLRPLFDLPGVTCGSLQRGPECRTAAQTSLPDWSSDNITLAASRMMNLDLIISVDSMPAHLAGALGRPVWTLLRTACDWRWMETGSSSPWYPTMRLFRQRVDGDWRSVVDEVRFARKARATQRSGRLALRA
jgi:hypothetical protein